MVWQSRRRDRTSKSGFTKPILILGYTPKPLYPAMIRYDIATAVFTMEMAKEISDTAVAMHKNANIHIKLDTGMSRIGFAITKESKEIIEQIAKLPGIEIKGCFSHLHVWMKKIRQKQMNNLQNLQKW